VAIDLTLLKPLKLMASNFFMKIRSLF